jgi:hypothetical protein
MMTTSTSTDPLENDGKVGVHSGNTDGFVALLKPLSTEPGLNTTCFANISMFSTGFSMLALPTATTEPGK